MKTQVVTNLDGEQLPIIEIETQAPDATRAKALANATVTGLTDYLDTRAAADEEVEAGKRLRVSGLGAAQVTVSTRGPGRIVALGATVFVFLAGCVAILLGSALARGWRQAQASEFIDVDQDPVEEFAVDDLDLELPPLSLALDPSDSGREARAS